MTQIKPNLLFSPGPTMVSPKSLNILSHLGPHHRTEAFKADFSQTLKLLKEVFQTSGHVFCLTSSGTGAMEASLINLVEPGQKVLVYNAGKFGERWKKMAQNFGLELDEIQQNWGTKFDLKVFEKHVQKQKYHAFLVQACETSTATRQPLDEIGKILKKHQPDCLFIVDGITAVGAYDVNMDDLGIDALSLGSQKALGLTTGLSFVGLSLKALEIIANNNTPKFYFDLMAEKKANENRTSNFSTPVAQVLALKFKLEVILKSGLKNYFQKTHRLQEHTLGFLEALKCERFSQSPSPSLSAFYLPQKQDVSLLQKDLLQDGLYLAGGQDDFKGQILRWGHMGDISIEHQELAYQTFAKHFLNYSSLSKEQIQKIVQSHCESLQEIKLVDECLP